VFTLSFLKFREKLIGGFCPFRETQISFFFIIYYDCFSLQLSLMHRLFGAMWC
jgi:hypothetical protein